jgi:prepilin-type N-terminal cleavage/methylation domain-containing protein
MKPSMTFRKRGFTLLETVIAIGVLSVLLTGFIVVFTPAAQGIKKSINVQQADRLASTFEQELVTLRTTADTTNFGTGFGKAFDWIKNSNAASTALLAYQYRGMRSGSSPLALRTDDYTATPVPSLKSIAGVFDKLPFRDYVVVSMLRRVNFSNVDDNKLLSADLAAVEGPVYLVKCTQLKFSGGNLNSGTAGSITDPKGTGATVTSATDYTEAVIAYSADFYQLPSSSASFVFINPSDPVTLTDLFINTFNSFVKNPVFTRNFTVGR